MSRSKLLGIALGVALFQYITHTYLFLSARPRHGEEEERVIEAMKSHHWEFSGFSRSYWDFYYGYGLLAILLGVVEIVSLWQLSLQARTDPHRITPLVTLWLFMNLAHGILILNYFFILPAVFDFLMVILLTSTLITSGKRQAL